MPSVSAPHAGRNLDAGANKLPRADKNKGFPPSLEALRDNGPPVTFGWPGGCAVSGGFALYRPMGAASDSAPGGACQAFRPSHAGRNLDAGAIYLPRADKKEPGSHRGLTRWGASARRTTSPDGLGKRCVEHHAAAGPLVPAAPGGAKQAFWLRQKLDAGAIYLPRADKRKPGLLQGLAPAGNKRTEDYITGRFG